MAEPSSPVRERCNLGRMRCTCTVLPCACVTWGGPRFRMNVVQATVAHNLGNFVPGMKQISIPVQCTEPSRYGIQHMPPETPAKSCSSKDVPAVLSTVFIQTSNHAGIECLLLPLLPGQMLITYPSTTNADVEKPIQRVFSETLPERSTPRARRACYL